MSDDVRCPHCNGTGSLPMVAVKRFEADRNRRAVLVFKVSRLWGALAEMYVDSKKKNVTLDKLQTAVRAAYIKNSDMLTLDERTGRVADD